MYERYAVHHYIGFEENYWYIYRAGTGSGYLQKDGTRCNKTTNGKWGSRDDAQSFLDHQRNISKKGIQEKDFKIKQLSEGWYVFNEATNEYLRTDGIFMDWTGSDQYLYYFPTEAVAIDSLKRYTNGGPLDYNSPVGKVAGDKLTIRKPISKENNNMIAITNKTLINGEDISGMGDDKLFGMIAYTEGEIKNLEAIETKPKKLIKKIEGMRDSIKELVKLIDSRK